MRNLLITTTISAIALAAVDVAAQRGGRNRGGGGQVTFKFLTKKYDRNRDREITWKEYKRDRTKFDKLDRDGDGKITKDDFAAANGRGRGGRQRGGRQRGGEGAAKLSQAGDAAPDFELPLAKDTKKTVKLSSFKDKQPVALIFGSYT